MNNDALRTWQLLGLASLMVLVHAVNLWAADETKESSEAAELTREAFRAAQNKDFSKAVEFLDKALAKDPKRGELHGLKANFHEELGMYNKAVADYTAMMAFDEYQQRLKKEAALPANAEKPAWAAYQKRGEANFRAGNIDASIKDFDAYLKVNPKFEARHWMRGISYYYAGKYAEGAKQFELHRTVNPDDVENAAWHFFCNVKLKGLEKARAEMIPIKKDPRGKWMMVLLDMFAGKKKPFDVLLVCRDGSPSKTQLENRFCHAHLYIGLYYEVQGNHEKAFEHLGKSAVDFQFDHYMGAVSQVHFNRLMKKRQEEKKKSSDK